MPGFRPTHTLHPSGLRVAAVIALAIPAGCRSHDSSAAPTAATEATATPALSLLPVAKSYTAYVDGKPQSAPEIPMGDPATVARIIDEGVNRNEVMDHLTYLCTQIGPRLTGSTNAEKANLWARDQFASWGLTNCQIEDWGEIAVRFDRGPSTGKLLAETRRTRNGEETTEIRTLRDLEFTTLAWAAGTNGPARGPVLWMPETEEDYASIADRLPGAWLLLRSAPITSAGGIRAGRPAMDARYRHRDEVRKKVAEEKIDPATLPPDDRVLFAGISGFISTSRDERVWTSAAPNWRSLDAANIPPDVEVIVRLSDYDYMNSRLADGEDILAEFNCPNTFTAGPIPVYNTIAEIPGTERPDEVVIVSAHLDSWNGPGSQGTTDNGTGSSVTLEAARLLMAAGAKPKRTIRFILWTGEEQGLLGSRGYIKKHEDELERISAVFVDDGGTNYEGGLAATESMIPMLAAATAPINGVFIDSSDDKPMTVNVRTIARMSTRAGGGSSDHASFIAAGVPGFFWDEVGRADYGFGWHTQNDTMARAIPEYLRQSSTCAAVTAYNLACAPTLLPRPPKDPPKEEAKPVPPTTAASESKPAEVAPPTPPAAASPGTSN
ncbi:MAG: M20/M25/M40 family metallo-hydrolase [Phycisphaeraceae bacterium]|nr:M20/M25/M40 family metallo-hydrolase [Phycisphaeraceae bacterium]